MRDLATRLRDALAGRYSIEREIGRGGMATVFLVQDLRHDRPVALKVLHPDIASGVGSERFEREIRLAARLQHPHILPIHDSGAVPGSAGESALLWFTMSFVDGESLRDRLTREVQLPVTDALRITGQIADALDYAHRRGVIHRDVKPENILLSEGHALLADFGVARALTHDSSPGLEGLTATGMSVGTVAYMSPEQASGEKDIDARTDQYSLACVLYEMLTGEPPFTGPTAQIVITRRFVEEPRPLRATRPGVPAPVERAVATALARIPADRFPSVMDFARALEGPALPVGDSTAAASVASAKQRRWLRPAAIGGAALIVVVGAFLAWRGLQPNDAGAANPSFLAVLPFENLGDSADSYFADGITDEVRGKLASLPGFHVIARSSASQYRGNTKPLRDIGRELGARYLLTGTVRWLKVGGNQRVQVRPELVEVLPNGRTVSRWGEPFDAPLTDVFQVQAGIAGRVATALQVAVTPAIAPALARAPTTNLAAYDEFLRGEKAYFGSSGPLALRDARGHYERAVALDSTFTRAWGRLSQVHSSIFFNLGDTEAAEAARRSAERALALDARLPETHLAVGNELTLVRNDYPRAIAAYQAGLALNPNHAELLGALGFAEQGLGRLDDAIADMQRGLALDPRSLLFTRRLVRALTLAHRFAEAEEVSRRALSLGPADASAILYAALLRLAQGDLAGARAISSAIPADADLPALLAYWSSFTPVHGWYLDDNYKQLLLRLPMSAFDNRRGDWGIALASLSLQRGDTAAAHVYGDTAVAFLQTQVAKLPDDSLTQVQLGYALALSGRAAEGLRLAEPAFASRENDRLVGQQLRHTLMQICILAGDYQKALGHLEVLVRLPYYLTPAWLRIDPTLAPLRNEPRFRKLIEAQ